MRIQTSILIGCLLAGLSVPALGASRHDHEDCDSDDYARIIAGCTQIAQDPKEGPKMRAIALVGRGLAHQDRHELDSAIADFTQALQLNPKDPLAYNNRGLAYNEKGDHEQAIADLTKAIEIDPLPRSDVGGNGHVNIYANRGLAFQAAGDLQRAIKDFDEAVARDGSDWDALNRRGYAWQQAGEVDRAIADFSAAIAIAPKMELPHLNRAMSWMVKRQPELALRDFTDTIGLDPKAVDAYYGRAQIYLAKSDPDSAIADLNEAIRLTSQPYLFYLRGMAWYDRYMHTSERIDPQDLKRAIADFSDAILMAPYYDDAYRARAAARATDGDAAGAAEDLAVADNKAPPQMRLDPHSVLK
jgi:tetratricopeptide (TPR) repeat protein